MFKFLTPKSIKPPFARYSHGVEVPAGKRLVLCSGQLGIGPDDAVPEDAGAQAELCFANIAAILAEAGLGLGISCASTPMSPTARISGPTWTCATGCLPIRRRPRR